MRFSTSVINESANILYFYFLQSFVYFFYTFDLIIENLNIVSRPITETTDLPYFIDSGSISLNFSDVMSTVTLTSIYPQGFERTQSLGSTKSTAEKNFEESRILGRTVKLSTQNLIEFKLFKFWFKRPISSLNSPVAASVAAILLKTPLKPLEKEPNESETTAELFAISFML